MYQGCTIVHIIIFTTWGSLIAVNGVNYTMYVLNGTMKYCKSVFRRSSMWPDRFLSLRKRMSSSGTERLSEEVTLLVSLELLGTTQIVPIWLNPKILSLAGWTNLGNQLNIHTGLGLDLKGFGISNLSLAQAGKEVGFPSLVPLRVRTMQNFQAVPSLTHLHPFAPMLSHLYLH